MSIFKEKKYKDCWQNIN